MAGVSCCWVVYSLRKGKYSPDFVWLAFEVAALGKDLNLISQTKDSGISGIRPNTYSSIFFFICTITTSDSVEFGRQMAFIISSVISIRNIEKYPGGLAAQQVNTVMINQLTGQSYHGSLSVPATWPEESFARWLPSAGGKVRGGRLRIFQTWALNIIGSAERGTWLENEQV